MSRRPPRSAGRAQSPAAIAQRTGAAAAGPGAQAPDGGERAPGADAAADPARPDPLRAQRVDALARRAGAHDGAVRRLLDARVAALAAGLAAPDVGPRAAPHPHPPPPGALRGLLAHLAETTVSARGPAAPAAFPELPALDEFRRTWAELRSGQQMRQSLQPLPDDAGPLNSAVLVQRALTRMRELSPGYLRHFLDYVDALSWVERLHDGGVLAGREAPKPAGGSRPARKAPPSRRR